jgi:hypothetical protein
MDSEVAWGNSATASVVAPAGHLSRRDQIDPSGLWPPHGVSTLGQVGGRLQSPDVEVCSCDELAFGLAPDSKLLLRVGILLLDALAEPAGRTARLAESRGRISPGFEDAS